jgi:transposase
MSNRRFEVFEYRHVIDNMRKGVSDRSIASKGLMGRAKCKEFRALAQEQGWLNPQLDLPSEALIASVIGHSQEPLPQQTPKAEPHREYIKRCVAMDVSARVIHQRLVQDKGYKGSYNSVQRFVAKLKASQPRTTSPMSYAPGEAAQIDFGKGPTLKDPETGQEIKTWFFVMVLCWSRHMYAELVTDQSVETWLGCHRRAFEWFGGVPKHCVIDNPKCAITKACYYEPEVQRSYGDCAQGYGFIISPCPVRDPQKKGRVESGVKYVKNNFAPLRDFRNLADANQSLRQWLVEEAGNRVHGTTQTRPLTAFEDVERGALMPLPDKVPTLPLWRKAKVQADCHIRFERSYYSVPHKWVGKHLWVRATEGLVEILHEHNLLCAHIRQRHPGSRVTKKDHLPAHAQAYFTRTPQWCLEQAELIGNSCVTVITTLLENPIVEQLRATQATLGLAKKYGKRRLEAACTRAVAFEDPRYGTVKSILEKGLDQLPDMEKAFDHLAQAYLGAGRYCRDPDKLMCH